MLKQPVVWEQVEDPPEIESMEDEVLLMAWKDKTVAEINELVLIFYHQS